MASSLPSTPDPARLAAVDPGNPQSWNRYAYVNGSPLNATDPLGLAAQQPCFDGENCNWDPVGCTIDGMDVGCAEAQQQASMLGGGGMVECPGSCYATNAVNLPIEYKATTGGNYWACQIPGMWKSQQAAGVAAVACADGPSIALGTELSGDIYENGSGYSFTLATPGSAAASPFDPSAIPAGSSYAGNYHTHGADDPGYLNEMFSQAGCNGGRPCDIGLANSAANKGNPVYLGTPQGRVEVYYPGALGLPYGCVLIGAAVAAGSESSVAIPVCH